MSHLQPLLEIAVWVFAGFVIGLDLGLARKREAIKKAVADVERQWVEAMANELKQRMEQGDDKQVH